MVGKKKKTVIATNSWYGNQITLLEERGVDVRLLPDRADEFFLEEMKTAHALIPGLLSVSRLIMENSPHLVIVAAHGVGYDNVDIPAANDLGIVVSNIPGVNSDTVAEFSFGLILALVRHIPSFLEEMKKGGWRRPEFWGVELRGKTLSIIGLGRIGSRVSRLGNAFGMKVLAYDPYIPEQDFRNAGAQLASRDAAISQADFLTLHVPITAETRNMIDTRELAMMKKTALLINTARGGIVNEIALVKALDQELLAGAGIDVFEEEPPQDRRLAAHPQVISSPHIAGLSNEARYRMSRGAAERVAHALKGEMPPDVVNHPQNPRYIKMG